MKKLTNFNSDPYIFFSLLLVSISIILTFLIILTGQLLPNRLPLFYSLPWGQSQLVNKNQLLIIPAAISLISLVNFIILSHLHQSQDFFKKILIFTSVLSFILLMITAIKIVLIFL